MSERKPTSRKPAPHGGRRPRTAKATRRKSSREQARAWLYVVIGPVIGGLDRELFFLRRKDPAWRFRAKRSESLRPIHEYVDGSQQATLQQFIRFFPAIGKLAGAHDRRVLDVERAAADAQTAIIELPELLLSSEVLAQGDPPWLGASPKSDAAQVIAEHAINFPTGAEISAHYPNAWKQHGLELQKLRETPEARPKLDALYQALEALQGTSTDLRQALSERRDSLADDFGLPPNPPMVQAPVFPEF